MKQKLFGRLAAAAVLLLGATTATAHDFEVDGIYYNKYDGNNTATVTYKGDNYYAFANEYSGAVSIPSEVTYEGTTYSVTSIVNYAFLDCSGLTSVVIPNSVNSIGDEAFSGCRGLTSVEIPNSITSIGSHAFYGCSGLTSVVIPNSITSIGRNAFYECSGLTSVVIPNSVNSIGDNAFDRCSGLESITVESGNTVYDSRDNCNALIETATNTLLSGCKNTIIPNSVTTISNYAFSGCTGLTSVVIPNSVNSIGNYAFYECSGLTSVEIPNSVNSIGDYTFWGCRSLTSVVIPNSVTSIGFVAFCGCNNLKIVFYNATNSTCGGYAFDVWSCTYVIGENVTNLPDKLFANSCTVVSHAAVLPVISANTFNSNTTVYVSSDAYPNYFLDDVWGKMNIQRIQTPVTSIALNVEDTHIGTNSSSQLAATITPADATLPTLYWSSDNPKVARVDQNGLVQGLSDGEATITAMAIDGSGVVATCHVTVGEIIAETLQLDPAEIKIETYESAVITPIYTPTDISNTNFEWTSSNESVARFKKNDNGTITVLGITDGEAVITCHTTDGSDLTATCTVTVGNGPATDVTCVAVQDDENPADFYATFSNNATDVELHPAAGATLTVYDVTVNGTTLVLTPRDANTVARGEAVLVKTSYNTFTASPLSGSALTPAKYGTATLLVATPSEAQTVSCQAGEAKLYRLTYYDINKKTGLGFYWGSDDGTQVKAKPGKGYLKVPTSQAAEIKGFRINPLPTHVDGIDAEVQGSDEPIYDLSGRRVENPTRGIYLQNNKKIIVK